jgi:hypothetical protein
MDRNTMILLGIGCIIIYYLWMHNKKEGYTDVNPTVTQIPDVPTPPPQQGFNAFDYVAEQLTQEQKDWLTPRPMVNTFLLNESTLKCPNWSLRPAPPVAHFSDAGMFNVPDVMEDTKRNMLVL